MGGPDAASLLRSLDRWDQAWANHNADDLQNLLSPNCTLHADGVLLEHDLKGADPIIDLHRRYFGKFDFKHELIACAANPETRSGFGFWQDHNLRREEGQEPGPGEGTDIAGMWKAVFNHDCSAVEDIYFLRQLHAEEAEHRLKDPKSIAKGGIDSSRYPKATTAAEAEGQKHTDEQKAARKAAEKFSEIWQTGDVSLAEEIMEEDMRSTDLMHGGELKGRQAWCDMIKKVSKDWKPTKSSYDVGVSMDGRVALVHWVSEGSVPESEKNIEMYGLNMLQVNPQNGKIEESVGFRQFSPIEREKMLKPDAFTHGTKEQ